MRSPDILASSFSRNERPVSFVPRPVLVVLALALAAQILMHGSGAPPRAEARDLPGPPQLSVLRAFAFGEEAALSGVLMLWLQAFDHQPGISVPFRELDYERVVAWLDRILALEPRAQYPLLSAARVYTEVPEDGRRRRMIGFVREKYPEDPARRWPWMAHAVFVANHRIGDPGLALDLARELRVHAPEDVVPSWARQMELFVLEDLGEEEAAKVLLGGLIESGAVSDPNEIRFLTERLGGNQ
ncbi:MAG TPA: hypothetical protein VIC61_04685 [Gammaproteobacteria bacterium]